MTPGTTIVDQGIQRLLRSGAPDLIAAAEAGGRRGAEEIARYERSQAPKAFSTLLDSIKATESGPGAWIVAPGVDYAQMVDQGTHGPYTGFPDHESILDWVKVKGLTPNDPSWDQSDLAWAIARKIRARGTKAQPFASKLVDSGFARAMFNLRVIQSVKRALAARQGAR